MGTNFSEMQYNSKKMFLGNVFKNGISKIRHCFGLNMLNLSNYDDINTWRMLRTQIHILKWQVWFLFGWVWLYYRNRFRTHQRLIQLLNSDAMTTMLDNKCIDWFRFPFTCTFYNDYFKGWCKPIWVTVKTDTLVYGCVCIFCDVKQLTCLNWNFNRNEWLGENWNLFQYKMKHVSNIKWNKFSQTSK